MTRDNQFLIKLTDLEVKELKDVSEEYGRSRGSLIREAISLIRDLDKRKRFEKKLEERVKNLNNVFQAQSDFILKVTENQYRICKKYELPDYSRDDFLIDTVEGVKDYQLSAENVMEKLNALK